MTTKTSDELPEEILFALGLYKIAQVGGSDPRMLKAAHLQCAEWIEHGVPEHLKNHPIFKVELESMIDDERAEQLADEIRYELDHQGERKESGHVIPFRARRKRPGRL